MKLFRNIMCLHRFVEIEWFTLLLIFLCYANWLMATAWLYSVAPVLTIVVTGILIAFHSSLSHEVLHGHPTSINVVNEALIFVPLNLMIPFQRFRALHLAHHQDSQLTDPYDDPESNYADPVAWNAMPRWKRWILQVNNTLLGRMVVGPILGQCAFFIEDFRLISQGDRAVCLAWFLNVVGACIVFVWLIKATSMPIWVYGIAIHFGLGLLKIRTFLEHRAHERIRCRTVIVEDRGPLAFLFLNNNLHAVHHCHPRVPWYRLPAIYWQNKDYYLRKNNGYVYRSYMQVILRYLFVTKDPVPHPLLGQK